MVEGYSSMISSGLPASVSTESSPGVVSCDGFCGADFGLLRGL